jgi:hypothetical protein
VTAIDSLSGRPSRRTATLDPAELGNNGMSRRNGDRARFQKDRKRKLRHRQRLQVLIKAARSSVAMKGH